MADKTKVKAKEEIERKTKAGQVQTANDFKSLEQQEALKDLLRADNKRNQPRTAFDDVEDELKRRRGGVGGKYLGSLPAKK